MYYGRCFTNKDNMMRGITMHIHYYKNQRQQRNLNVMRPIAFHKLE
ncbi:hypothetical protein [Anaerostipes rhamnosivorans]